MICLPKLSRYSSQQLTTRVVTGSQQNTTGSLPDTDQVTGSRGTEDAVLADEQLFDTVSGTNLCDLLNNLGVVVTAITGDNEGGILSTFGDRQDDAGHEGFGVVGLLEDLDLLTKTGAVERESQVRCDGNEDVCIRSAADLRSRLLVLERLDGNGLDRHNGFVDTCGDGTGEEEEIKCRPLIVTDN